MVGRTQETYKPRTLNKDDITNWNYIQDRARFPDIKIHTKMKGWDWYSYTEKIAGKSLTFKVMVDFLQINGAEVIAGMDKTSYEMMELQMLQFLPYIDDIKAKLQTYFMKDYRSWIPNFKYLDKGLPAMTITGELAHVGDELAKFVWDNGTPGHRVMRWMGEDGKERAHIDFSHKPLPEIEFTHPGSFADDAESHRLFKEDIGPREEKTLVEDMDPVEFGNMILDIADKKWSHRVDHASLVQMVSIVYDMLKHEKNVDDRIDRILTGLERIAFPGGYQ